MDKELQDKLYNKYVELFDKECDLNRFTGFQCGNGWYSLLDTFFETVNHHLKFHHKIVKISNIKEKFGYLSMNFDKYDEFVMGAYSMAVHSSSKICEECGTNNNIGHTSTWIRHICIDCYDKDTQKYYDWTPNVKIDLEKIRGKIE